MNIAKVVLGIDVSKDKLDVMLLGEPHAAQAQQFGNTAAGAHELGQWLKRLKHTRVHVCMEATGRYHERVAEALHAAGHTVSVVNPAQIKAYAASQLNRTKTDQVDARLIAEFCLRHDLPAWSPPRQKCGNCRRCCINCKPSRMRASRKPIVANRLGAGVQSHTVQDMIRDHLTFLDHQMADLERRIREWVNRHPHLRQQRDLLASIPGIGDLTAARLLALRIDRFDNRFDNADQLAAFAGLTPKHRQSGSSVRGKSTLSKIGHATVRRDLYMPAITAMAHNPVIQRFTNRLAEHGKISLVIITAAMRKLLCLAYAVLKSGQPFDPLYGLRSETASTAS